MTTLWCIHGNLQLPSVWDALIDQLHQDFPTLTVHAIDLWASVAQDCPTWAAAFCQQVEAIPGPHLLLGYSLGGRLALHATVHQPALWQGVMAVAADPGLTDEGAKQRARDCDRIWANRFASDPRVEPWASLLADWDQLSVFGGRTNPCRRPETAFCRATLAAAFINYSKGNQTNLTPILAQLPQPPIWFVSGQADPRYSRLGQQLAKHCPQVKAITIPHAAHRVPWENTTLFNQLVQNFIQAQTALTLAS
jgi:2-succinyl-6-hydroxy-2,4-cyclohexadiene-1-carboxylate synthase